jgi:hypothetical protein
MEKTAYIGALYSAPSIIRMITSRRMRWAGCVAGMGEKRNAYSLLTAKPEGKRPLGRPRHRLLNDIKLDIGEIGWGDVDWIGLAQDRNKWRTFGFHKMLGSSGMAIQLMTPSSNAQLHRVSYFGFILFIYIVLYIYYII